MHVAGEKMKTESANTLNTKPSNLPQMTTNQELLDVNIFEDNFSLIFMHREGDRSTSNGKKEHYS